MILSKILVFILSIVAVPLKHVNDAEQNSVLALLPDQGMNNEKEEIVGWRTRIEEDGWLHALRCLSIIEVRTSPKYSENSLIW